MPIAFGKYQLQRKLAEGGMAEVFLGRQAGMEGFEKLIVVKRIRPELSSDPNFVNMFLNEARVAARLNHPNVVQIFELGKVDKQYFIAMEFIHGEDLRSLTRAADLAKRHPSPGLICRIVADTLAGLHYAHTRTGSDGKPLGLVHRDVSPQNVLVTYEGAIKVVDFGIAKATRGGAVEQTRAGLFKGKFAYMSPEQSRGQPLDARSDVFAVGILLWELLTWTRLFKRANDMATLIAVAEEEIPSPLSFDATLPQELERIVMKSLDRRIHMRYLTAAEMRADLEALIRKQGWEADSLALETFMRGVFADKLRRQEEDIRESGFGSLEDFLLTVDEKSTVSWIKSVNVKTPSSGLPEARLPGMTRAAKGAVDPIGNTQEVDVPEMEPMPNVDSGGLELGGEVDELPGEATSFSPMPVFDEDLGVRKIKPDDMGTADTAPVTEIPKELRPALFGTKKKADAATLPPIQQPIQNRPTMPPMSLPNRQTLPPLAAPPNTGPGELQALPTAIVSRPSDLPSLPTAIVAPKTLEPPARPTPTPGPSATVELSAAAFDEQPTARPDIEKLAAAMTQDPNQTLRPGQASNQAMPAGGMQAVAFPSDPTMGQLAPRDPFTAGNTTAPRPIVDPPARKRWPLAVVGAAVLILGVIAVLVRSPGAPPMATLEINLDQPAVVSVDGKAEPMTQKATVQVKPGIAHVITVEHNGKVVRTLNVPGMQPNEQLQLNVIVK